MHKVTKDLQEFYDSQAEKFSGSRKREWPEFSYIMDEIAKTIESERFGGQTPIRILELGCGDGRLLSHLQEYLKENTIMHNGHKLTEEMIEYVGVDVSLELLKIANKNHPKARWIHQDMTTFVKNTPQEYFDIVIAVASFHHLPTKYERETALGFIYYTLSYEGSVIMTNWCYSDWFRNKFKKQIQKAFAKALYTLGKTSKNDIMVPRKANDGSLVADRLYHIFSLKELGNLFEQSGFTHIKQLYITNEGETTNDERNGRNLFSVAKKSIWK